MNTKAADAGANHHAHAGLVYFFNVQCGVLDGFCHSAHGELLEAVAAAYRLRVLLEEGSGVVAAHLTGNVDIQRAVINAFNLADAGATVFHALPCFLNTVAEGGKSAHTCNNYATICHNA